jgi:predicted nuclease of predicted toxin-antitoxin system
MKIKLDHNLSPYLADILIELGHDTLTANEEGLSKASDALLLYQTTIEERILFTLDKGFANVDTYPRATHAGIVVLSRGVMNLLKELKGGLLPLHEVEFKRK